MAGPPLVALYDTETNGLLPPCKGKSVATKMHCIFIMFSDGRMVHGGPQGYHWTHAPAYGKADITLPNGTVLQDVLFVSNAHAIELLYEADIRVGHNSQDFDDRICRKFYPHLVPRPGSICRDTLLISRLLYPVIGRDGPNTHKCPPQLRMRHSVEAWGYRLGEKKNKDFDPGDWQTWTPEMSTYMMQDVLTLRRIWKWLMFQKPDPRAVEIEHDFAAIIRRQECWGFTFNRDAALDLQQDLQKTIRELESELIETYGSWWAPGKVQSVKASRKVKVLGQPDIVQPRWNAKGARLAKDYVGPPLCYYEEGATFTPIERVEFNPSSRDHVRLMLYQRHGWVPTQYTDKGAPKVDDEVLRALPFPEAPKLADYYSAMKILGYVSTGRQNWLDQAYEEMVGVRPNGAPSFVPEWRMHGSVNTIGTYTFRCSHSGPNMGQIPTRDETFGHRCRSLFRSRARFLLAGFDGSALQLRLFAHYLSRWDGGAYIKIVSEGDPHAFIRDLVGTDLMGIADAGRARGKTLNYTLLFGGGDTAVGRVVEPYSSDSRKQSLGREIKERGADLFGPMSELVSVLKARVEDTHSLVGLDGRIAHVTKPHTALSTLLQMAEGVVMKLALVIFDAKLQAAGMVPGVGPDGVPRPELADYEFCVNVHDEAQADILPKWEDTYRRLALESLPEAGRRLGVKCPLKAEVKVGSTWNDTH